MKKVFIGAILLLTLTTIFAYTVRVGDTIAIEVFGQPEFSRTVKLAFDGTIPYPYAGNVKVVGLTTDQIKSIIEQTVRRFIKDPVVTVYVVDYGPMYVYLQGAINRIFDISNYKEVTLTQLFSLLVLSPSSEIDFETIQLRRAGKTQTLNMLSYFYDGTITDDPKLQEGDVIYFPPLKYSQTIQVSGAYTYIGRYEPGMTLKTLILRLGTLDKEKAILESSYLTVSGKTIVVNLEDVISGKIDYPILSGSSLYIPKREERFIYVVGFVPSPGPKTFLSTEPLTLAYALAKSGGISPDNEKWIEKITITTPDGKTREYTPDIIKSSENLLLQTGSIVNVVKYPEFKVYLTGDFSTGLIVFEPTEPKTLKTLLTKVGGLKTDQLKWIEWIKVNDKLVDLAKLDDYTLSNNDSVEIKKYPEFKVYVTGDYKPGIVSFEPDEPRTLEGLLTKLGGIPVNEQKWIESVTINGQPADISKAASYMLNNGDKVEIRRYAEFKIYLSGDFSTGIINFEPQEPKTLKTLLTKIGGLKTDQLKWIESIKINDKAVELSKVESYTLSNGDSVEIKKYPEFKVYVTGDYKPGTVLFEPDEPRTLEGLLTKLGGIPVNEQKWIESVTINGQAADISKAASYMLNNGDKVEIRRYAEFKIYLSGDFSTGIINFDPQEPKTLKTLLTKIGGLKTDQLKWIESIKINDKAVELSKLESYTLSNGDSVEIKKYPEFYVYVQGYANAKGKIVFEPQEPKTLKTLINKIGLTSPDVENEGQAIINNATAVALKDVVYSNKDVPLSLGDTVLISYEPFLVYVTGSGMPGVVQLSYYEPKTLSYIFKKLVNTPENIEQVTLVRSGKETVYSPNDLLYGLKDSVIERNDTVVFKQADVNAVYLIGDVSSYVSFALNEPITIQRILAKVGLSDFRRIESITLDGTNVNFTSDISIPKGAILKVQLKKPVFVTAMGYIRNTGRVQFDYYETPDLKTLFAKLGGLIVGPENYYASDKVLVIREGKLIGQFDAENIFKGIENAELKDGDFVYVTQKDPNQVYVFGKGVPNGLFKFTQGEEFDLRTLIGKLGGIKEGVSRKLTIVSGDKVESIKWDEYTNFKLTSNSIILFDVDKENYVYIIRQDGRPDMIYTDKPTTLYEILTKVGIDKNYRKIELTRGTEKQLLELKDLAQARGYNVYPGDVVKVLDVPQNFAYVLGEVNKPGIVQLTEGTTVLQAVIQAGYFTAKAAPSTVWVYKGGVDGKVEKVNLSGAISGGRVDNNIILESGDIVFVPSDPFKSALEWIPVINNLITFYNNVSGLFK